MTMRDNAETARLCAERGDQVLRLTESLERLLHHCQALSTEPGETARKDFEEAAQLILESGRLINIAGGYPPLSFSELACTYRVMRVVTQLVVSGKLISPHSRDWLIDDIDKVWDAFIRIGFLEESKSEPTCNGRERHGQTAGAGSDAKPVGHGQAPEAGCA